VVGWKGRQVMGMRATSFLENGDRAVRLGAVAVLCVVMTSACGTTRRGTDPLGAALQARRLMVPVEGVAPDEVADTFFAPRDGGRRTHGASDIMAPEGTPVVAADEGRIFKIRQNRLGGLTLYATDPSQRFLYYYAHLSHYRSGLSEGLRIDRGTVLGYVGHTGNASANAPHLHFQVMEFELPRWWDGRAIDARPYFLTPGRVTN
jgi:peptidoglycan LD-endopeptidase LytH